MSFVFAEKNKVRVNDETIRTMSVYSDTKVSFDNNPSNWSDSTQKVLKQYGLIKTLILNSTCCLSFAGNNLYYVNALLSTLETSGNFTEQQLCNQAYEIHQRAPKDDIEFIICYVKSDEQHIVCIKDGKMEECDKAWIGSYETYRTMQAYRMEKLNDPIYQNGVATSELFRNAIQTTEDDTVGKDIIIETRITSESNSFFYVGKVESFAERRQTVPVGETVKLIDTVAEGGFTAEYYESTDEVRIDFKQADLTILYTKRYRLDQLDVDNPNTRYFLLPIPIRTSSQQVINI